MALRVLLADESVTIKKVFQLALQDFAVEVTPVALGPDVATVATRLQPDIVFADVLLQKKNGYDVCKELKSNPALSKIPVVLVWSGFMELDEPKYRASGANAHLEKPFDTAKLRQIVQSLVAKTKAAPLAPYLTFPKLPDFAEKGGQAPKTSAPKNPAPPTPPIPGGLDLELHGQAYSTPSETASNAGGTWSMESFDPLPTPEIDDTPEHNDPPTTIAIDLSQDDVDEGPAERSRSFPVDSPEEFTSVTLSGRTRHIPKPQVPSDVQEIDDDPEWVQKTLTQFRLNPEQQQDDPPQVSYNISDEEIDPETINRKAATSAPKPVAKAQATARPQHLANAQPARTQPQPTRPAAPVAKAAAPARPNEAFELNLAAEDDDVISPSQILNAPKMPQLNQDQLLTLIKAQSKEMIEKVIWQVLPEIATQIIEREIAKLIAEREKKRS